MNLKRGIISKNRGPIESFKDDISSIVIESIGGIAWKSKETKQNISKHDT